MEWNENIAKSACQELAFRIGQSSGQMRLVRFGENCIYHLLDSDIVFRAYRPTKSLQEISNEISICHFLSQREFPVPAVFPTPEAQPYRISGIYVSVWRWISHDPKQKVDWMEFGRLMSAFHNVAKSYSCERLPKYNPFPKMRARLEIIRGLENTSKEEINCLATWVENLHEKFDNLGTGLSVGVIHGDAHPGNVIIHKGKPYLLDFEGVSCGDQIWDLIPMIVSMRRFNLSKNNVENFFEGYGQDILSCKFLGDAVSIRELHMTLWLFQNVDQNPSARKELDIRMLNWLSDRRDSSSWGAF